MLGPTPCTSPGLVPMSRAKHGFAHGDLVSDIRWPWMELNGRLTIEKDAVYSYVLLMWLWQEDTSAGRQLHITKGQKRKGIKGNKEERKTKLTKINSELNPLLDLRHQSTLSVETKEILSSPEFSSSFHPLRSTWPTTVKTILETPQTT